MDAVWNRGLPDGVRITLRVRWPLLVAPFLLINQILTPHPLWVAILIVLLGMYGLAYFWVRTQAPAITLQREREGMLLVAGDVLKETFELRNASLLPLLWAEFLDGSDLPGYTPGHIVACNANSFYQWRIEVECRQRGVYQLGPSRLSWGDPFSLFRVDRDFPYQETLLIYPRVAQLPEMQLPHGSTSGTRQRQLPLHGSIRSASVREYRPGDSLRHIHWRTTAHRNSFMVTELDTEPGGEVWIVLDLNAAVHAGAGETGTLEYSIIVAASLAAQLLTGDERHAVGLITAASTRRKAPYWEMDPLSPSFSNGRSAVIDASSSDQAGRDAGSAAGIETVVVAPQIGQAQLWRILAALAPVQPIDLPLTTLLHGSHDLLGRGRTIVIITPLAIGPEQSANRSPDANAQTAAMHVDGAAPVSTVDTDGAVAPDWLAELVHVRSHSAGSVLLIVPEDATPDEQARHFAPLQKMLAQNNIPVRLFNAGDPLPSVLTYRRTRKVIRTTPSGGAIAYEVEEEVG